MEVSDIISVLWPIFPRISSVSHIHKGKCAIAKNFHLFLVIDSCKICLLVHNFIYFLNIVLLGCRGENNYVYGFRQSGRLTKYWELLDCLAKFKNLNKCIIKKELLWKDKSSLKNVVFETRDVSQKYYVYAIYRVNENNKGAYNLYFN